RHAREGEVPAYELICAVAGCLRTHDRTQTLGSLSLLYVVVRDTRRILAGQSIEHLVKSRCLIDRIANLRCPKLLGSRVVPSEDLMQLFVGEVRKGKRDQWRDVEARLKCGRQIRIVLAGRLVERLPRPPPLRSR